MASAEPLAAARNRRTAGADRHSANRTVRAHDGTSRCAESGDVPLSAAAWRPLLSVIIMFDAPEGVRSLLDQST